MFKAIENGLDLGKRKPKKKAYSVHVNHVNAITIPKTFESAMNSPEKLQ